MSAATIGATIYGSHGDVVINGDRAWWIYFGGQSGGNQNWAVIPSDAPSPILFPSTMPAPTPATSPARGGRGGRGITINVVELKVIDGKLMYTNPNLPVHIDLGNQREVEK